MTPVLDHGTVVSIQWCTHQISRSRVHKSSQDREFQYFRSGTLFVYGNPVFDPGISTFPTPFHLSSQAKVNSGPAASSEVAVKVIELEECLGGISSMCSCGVHLGLEVVGEVSKSSTPSSVLGGFSQSNCDLDTYYTTIYDATLT